MEGGFTVDLDTIHAEAGYGTKEQAAGAVRGRLKEGVDYIRSRPMGKGTRVKYMLTRHASWTLSMTSKTQAMMTLPGGVVPRDIEEAIAKAGMTGLPPGSESSREEYTAHIQRRMSAQARAYARIFGTLTDGEARLFLELLRMAVDEGYTRRAIAPGALEDSPRLLAEAAREQASRGIEAMRRQRGSIIDPIKGRYFEALLIRARKGVGLPVY